MPKLLRKLVSLSGSLLTAIVMVAGSAGQAAAFPDKEITVIVNYGAGGGTDLSTRVLAEAAAKILGQPMRVENRTGGSGTVGPTFIANAKPDGYTIGVASFSPMAIVPHLQEVPYKLDDFHFILGHARYRSGIAVRAESPFKTVEDIVAAAKGGQKITYTTTGPLEDILMTRLGQATGTEGKYQRVSYKSGSEATTASLGGVVDVLVNNPTNITPHVKSGTMRLLASVSSVRWYELPDRPTLKELGYDIAVESYAGLAAPAGTPADVIAVLEKAFSQALQDKDVQKTMKDLGMEPSYFTSAEYKKLVEDGYKAMGTDLVAIGLKKN